MSRCLFLVLFLFVELGAQSRVSEFEGGLAEVEISVATIARSNQLHFVNWARSSPGSDYESELKPFTLRTSGMSPAHEYTGPRDVVLYENSDARLGEDRPFAVARLPGLSGRYLMILSRGELHGERNVYFLNLDNLSIHSDTLTIFNATQASLESEVKSGKKTMDVSVSTGLTSGIPIGQKGMVTLEYTFRDDAKQWVFRDRFTRESDEHLILILVPPRVRGSRDLSGRWVHVDRKAVKG